MRCGADDGQRKVVETGHHTALLHFQEEPQYQQSAELSPAQQYLLVVGRPWPMRSDVEVLAVRVTAWARSGLEEPTVSCVGPAARV